MFFKQFFLICFIIGFLMIADLGFAAVTSSCSDTDSGANYFLAGKTTANSPYYGLFNFFSPNKMRTRVYGDICAANNYLIEYTCKNKTAYPVRYLCKSGCQTGRCLPEVASVSPSTPASSQIPAATSAPTAPTVSTPFVTQDISTNLNTDFTLQIGQSAAIQLDDIKIKLSSISQPRCISPVNDTINCKLCPGGHGCIKTKDAGIVTCSLRPNKPGEKAGVCEYANNQCVWKEKNESCDGGGVVIIEITKSKQFAGKFNLLDNERQREQKFSDIYAVRLQSLASDKKSAVLMVRKTSVLTCKLCPGQSCVPTGNNCPILPDTYVPIIYKSGECKITNNQCVWQAKETITPTPEPIPPASMDIPAYLGQTFNLKISQTAALVSENLKITLLSVKDGRCAPTLICFWPGEVKIIFRAIQGGQDFGSMTLSSGSTFGNSAKSFGNYTLKIEGIIARQTSEADYAVPLLVQKQATAAADCGFFNKLFKICR